MSLKDSVRKVFGDGMNNTPIIRERPPRKDELALGFAEGEDGRRIVRQMKGVLQEDRITHFYVMGASNMGKSKFLEYLIRQDIDQERGLGVIDPHAILVKNIKGYLALHGKDLEERVVLIDPTDKENTVCFNPLELTEGIEADYQAGQLVAAFSKIWGKAWGDRMANIFTHVIIALSENGLTLAEVQLILENDTVRRKLTRNLKNEETRQFFNKYETWSERVRIERTESTINKVSQFLTNTKIREMFMSPKSSFNLREIMDSGKILLVNLDKGQLTDSSGLLGSLLMSKIQMAAFSRSDMLESKLTQFNLFIDEFQNFADENFSTILDEARKYKLSLTLAHQHLGQLNMELKDSILANCGLQAYFHMSRKDADILAKEAYAGVFAEPQPWEWFIQNLQSLHKRWYLFKHEAEGGIAEINVPEVERPWEENGMSEERFLEFVRSKNIGQNYLRKRSDVDREYRTRRAALISSGEQIFKEKK
jgi:hypothetical protein